MERTVLTALIASMPVAVLVRPMLVAQLSAVRHGRHVPLLAGGVDWPYRPDIVHASPNFLSPKPRVVGIFQRR